MRWWSTSSRPCCVGYGSTPAASSSLPVPQASSLRRTQRAATTVRPRGAACRSEGWRGFGGVPQLTPLQRRGRMKLCVYGCCTPDSMRATHPSSICIQTSDSAVAWSHACHSAALLRSSICVPHTTQIVIDIPYHGEPCSGTDFRHAQQPVTSSLTVRCCCADLLHRCKVYIHKGAFVSMGIPRPILFVRGGLRRSHVGHPSCTSQVTSCVVPVCIAAPLSGSWYQF